MSVNIYGSSGGQSSDGTAVNKKYVDGKFMTLSTNLVTKVNKVGDVMTGDLNMGSNKICNVGKPVDRLDVVNKEYVELDFLSLTIDLQSKVNKDGDTMTGNLNMSSNKIIGVSDPMLDADVCNKRYVDELITQSINNIVTHVNASIEKAINKLTVQNKVGYIPILNSNWDSKYSFKVTTNSEIAATSARMENKQAYNVFTYKKTEWTTNGINRNFWIQIQCPERIKIWRFALRGKDSGQDCIYKWKLQGTNDIASSIWDDIYTANNDKVNMVMRYFHVNPRVGYITYRIFVEEAEGQNPGLSYWQLFTLDSVVSLHSG